MSIIGLTAGAPAQTPAATPGAGAAGGASPYTIQGGLNFGAAPEGPFGGDIQGSYTSAYNNALSLNQQNYANILSGYQQTAGNLAGTTQGAYGVLAAANQNQQGAQQGIQQGYGALGQNVQNTIQGIGASQSQAIADTYAQQSGALQQNLINSGLGNSTVLGEMERGPALDQQKAQIALSNQLAQLSAGYQSQLGLAGLGYANTANQQNTAQANTMGAVRESSWRAERAQANQQLQFQNSVQAPYPNAQTYAGLLANQGALGIAQQQLALAKQQAGRFGTQLPGSNAPPMYQSPGNTMSPYQQSSVGQQQGGPGGASPYTPQQSYTGTPYTGASGYTPGQYGPSAGLAGAGSPFGANYGLPSSIAGGPYEQGPAGVQGDGANAYADYSYNSSGNYG